MGREEETGVEGEAQTNRNERGERRVMKGRKGEGERRVGEGMEQWRDEAMREGRGGQE